MWQRLAISKVLNQTRNGFGAVFHGALLAGTDLLYPPTCAACHEEPGIQAGCRTFCDECRGGLFDPKQEWCPRCAAPAGPYSATAAGCRHCRNERYPFAFAVTLGRYDGLLKSLILMGKAAQGTHLMLALAEELARSRRDWFRASAIDAIVPVPHHWTHRLVRPQLPTETIAATLSRRLEIPCLHDAVVKIRRTLPQAGLSGTKRRSNVRNAFAGSGRPISGMRLLLVDDVMTTGGTAHAASLALLDAGAIEVSVAVLARSVT